ncbi:porin [Roseicyclus sp. F158]|uniref:Porin n=1 Tax=Tropicimonas omnivorans TaxID=3075590 RepID=A0ABU3DBX2_9RHOB|nr:porin [Roseicyclus sp. F158]MDT0681214.1 porin [Roseicyclus sp. F158]
MKNILLTSTALVAFAGAVAAEVTITGSAEMGVFGGGESATQFFQDVDVKFTLTGQTDGGLSFGAAVDLDEAGNLGNELDDQGVAIFVSGGFGTLTMGDTDGALDFVLTDAGDIGNPGSITDNETEHFGYLGSYLDGAGFADGQIIRYNYSFGDFAVAVSMEQNAFGDDGLVLEDQILGTIDFGGGAIDSIDDFGAEDFDDVNYSIGGTYETEFGGAAVTLGLGYQHAASADVFPFDVIDGSEVYASDADAIGVGAAFTLDSGFTAGFTYTDFNFGDDFILLGDGGGFPGVDDDEALGGVRYDSTGFELDGRHFGIGMGYTFDAFTVHANYGQYDYELDGLFDGAGGDVTVSGYGLALGYDLGGGANLLFGYGKSMASIDSDVEDIFFLAEDDFDIDNYSLGLSMAF